MSLQNKFQCHLDISLLQLKHLYFSLFSGPLSSKQETILLWIEEWSIGLIVRILVVIDLLVQSYIVYDYVRLSQVGYCERIWKEAELIPVHWSWSYHFLEMKA
jgi:hypothetical protein